MDFDIKKIREERGLSQKELSDLTGIPRGRINAWEQRGSMPKVADMEVIKKFLSETNVSLKTNPINNYKKNYIEHAPIGKFPKKVNKDQPIPFYDVDFAAGDIEFYNGNSTIQASYTMDIPEFSGCTAFRTYGDSMAKLIRSGDILFATKIEDWQSHLEYGQIYGIICMDRRRYLKYIRKALEKEESHFILRSENKDYDDFLIPKQKIKSLWLIHGWMNKRT